MNDKGFTLIELIATIALLAVVVSISFVSINAVIKSNKKEQCENLKSSIEAATKEYVSDNRYKSDFNLDGLNASMLNGYLSMPIVDPYTKDEITPSEIIINVSISNGNVSSVSTNIVCDDELELSK